MLLLHLHPAVSIDLQGEVISPAPDANLQDQGFSAGIFLSLVTRSCYLKALDPPQPFATDYSAAKNVLGSTISRTYDI